VNDDVLDDCNCCKGSLSTKPSYNRPGQPMISYRMGTHSSFLRRMVDRISRQRIPPGDADGKRPLSQLTTRSQDDPSMAILDAWAVVADVLTFYQERIANEGFLRTATERRSVEELARTVGYELKPGVAASTFLAFTVEEAQGSPKSAVVPVGTKVMSVPGQGEMPQTFETVEEIEARAECNALYPRRTETAAVKQNAKGLLLKGFNHQLQVGDVLIFIEQGSLKLDLEVITSVEPDPKRDVTTVCWSGGLPFDDPEIHVMRQRAALFGNNAPDWTGMPQPIKKAYLDAAKIPYSDAITEWPDIDRLNDGTFLDLDAPYPKILQGSLIVIKSTKEELLRKAKSVSIISLAGFGLSSRIARIELDERIDIDFHRRMTEVYAQSEKLEPAEVERTGLISKDRIELDREVHGLEKGRRLAVSGTQVDYSLFMAYDDAVTQGMLDASETVPFLYDRSENKSLMDNQQVRKVLMDSADKTIINSENPLKLEEGYELAIKSIDVNGNDIYLELTKDGTVVDQTIIAPSADNANIADKTYCYKKGLRKSKDIVTIAVHFKSAFRGTEQSLATVDGIWQISDTPMEGAFQVFDWRTAKAYSKDFEFGPWGRYRGIGLHPECEEAVLKDILTSDGRSTLILDKPLKKSYDLTTVTIFGNVAAATHGETVHEILGSGDGAQANQQFVLKKPPLTLISASIASGTESTLAVRVNDVLWQEEPSLYGLDHDSTGYILRTETSGRTTVIFGDGVKGARLPTGVENIAATYRSGIGLDGEVDAGKLTLLQTRPQGIRGVTNPLPASGSAGPESISQAKGNAALTAKTLDRIVSLMDFENFARSFASVGKAQAQVLDTGLGRLVHITVASASGSSVDPQSDTFKHLRKAIYALKDPMVNVQVNGEFRLLTFSLSARVLVDRKYIAKKVLAEVEDALRNAFSFEMRDFGQPVTAAEILMVAQSIDGIIAVDLLGLNGTGGSSGAEPPNINTAVLEAKRARAEGGRALPAELLLLNASASAVVLEEWDHE
jgi:hypothetical protein